MLEVVGVLSILSVLLSELITRVTKADGWWAQFQTWVVSIGLSFLAVYLGFFVTAGWFASVCYGILVGLSANGVFAIPITKPILQALKIRKATEKCC